MPNISLKIAYPIIIAGVFVMVAIMAFNYQNLNLSFYIIFLLLTVYVFLFGFATGQNFAKPVRKLLEKADDLNKGDLKSRFYLERDDEFGDLAKAFNRIAEKLETNESESQTLEKSLEMKVKTRTQALEETINALEQKVKNRTLELQKLTQEMEKLQEKLKPK